ncbi:hypothetical protein [Candidatus Uabimicrobium sp. HlEnr_7]|uniref:hypothetical protein n=1 Tax=Candidatus Uabimicrobium helgolandensis TaxID=3095367 RepID=UPI003558423A
MSYQSLLGKPLPQNSLVVPAQYLVFNKRYYCTFFLEIESEIGRGTYKRVEKAKVVEILGTLPLPEISSLKNTSIALYRPRESFDLFVNDVEDIIKLDEADISNYVIKSYIARIKGHSLFLSENYQGTIEKYSYLFSKNLIKKNIDVDDLQFCLRKSLSLLLPAEHVDSVANEILDHNDLINTPFMFSKFLPRSIEMNFCRTSEEEILQNVYDLVAMVCYHAAEGIYFRDLRPDNFRLNERNEIRLIDPSYISKKVKPRFRYNQFIQQTTPEYLPSELTLLLRQKNKHYIINYFAKFTEGVCVGMLERVLKKIFMPSYMKERYDSLHHLPNSERISQANQCKIDEDIDFFKDTSLNYDISHFEQYQKSIEDRIAREDVPERIQKRISKVIQLLRLYSKPKVSMVGCETFLQDRGSTVSIEYLPKMVTKVLGITPRLVKATNKYQGASLKDISQTKTKSGNVGFNTTKRFLNIKGNVHERFQTKRRLIKDLVVRPQKSMDLSITVKDSKLQEVFDIINRKHIRLKVFFLNNPSFFTKLQKSCTAMGSGKEQLLDFFEKADSLFDDKQVYESLEVKTKERLPKNIVDYFNNKVSSEFTALLEEASSEEKLENLVVKQVIRVVKICYLCSLDIGANIESYLPDFGKDLLDFVQQNDEEYSFKNIDDTITFMIKKI